MHVKALGEDQALGAHSQVLAEHFPLTRLPMPLLLRAPLGIHFHFLARKSS